jgi:pimeloyl-ACP methyl ester carboxylesterase
MSYELMAEDLFRYIVKNDLGRCILLGHSMGGRTVMTFASKYPELVEKLIVVDVAPVSYGSEHYGYHLDLMRNLKKLNLDEIRTRKQAEAEASKFIDVRD